MTNEVKGDSNDHISSVGYDILLVDEADGIKF